MKKILYVLIIAQLVMSCQDVLKLDREANLGNETSSENKYVISADDALAYLESFMAEAENFTTKSLTSRNVSSITPINYSALTRASQDNLSCDNLLYIANFEQDQGYAILAGDTRIGEKVIAIADDGQLSEATVYSAIELADTERIILEDYPATGAGFFTSPETESELLLTRIRFLFMMKLKMILLSVISGWMTLARNMKMVVLLSRNKLMLRWSRHQNMSPVHCVCHMLSMKSKNMNDVKISWLGKM